MAATTMHFGPEWMRAKPQSCPPRQQPPPPPPSSPPPPPSATHQLGPSTYSALLTHEPERRDESRPFRYTKDEMLRIYREGGGKGGLNLEVERWEGIVRDVASEPATLREMSEAEKKLFTGPLNSELRRRQSTDLVAALSSSDRQRLVHPNSTTSNTTRYGPFTTRRRDSTGQSTFTPPRKLSLSNTQGASLTSPRDALPSPRNRIGAFGSSFDGVLNSGDSWPRRRPSVSVTGTSGAVMARGEGKEEDGLRSEIKEEEENTGYHFLNPQGGDPTTVTGFSSSAGSSVSPSDALPDGQASSPGFDLLGQSMTGLSLEIPNQLNSNPQVPSTTNLLPSGPPGLTDPAGVEWSYLDPQGHIQGPFRADLMQKWFDEGYFTPDLLMKRTHVDVEWIAVGILERHAAGGKIFLPQTSNRPPGLVIRTEPPKTYSPVHEQNIFNGYSSVPTQTIRAPMDPSLNGSSPIESPSSSLGGRFGNGSPDPSTIGGRPGNNIYSSDPNFTTRTVTGRAAFQDSISDARIFSNNILGRVPTIDTTNAYNGGGDDSPWSAGPGEVSQGFNDDEHHPYSNSFNGLGSGAIGNPLSVNHVHSINHEHFGDAYNGIGGIGNYYGSPVARQPIEANEPSFNGNMANSLGPQFGPPTQLPQSASVPYTAPQHRQSVSPFRDLLPQTAQGPNVTQTPTSAVQPNSASPWTTGTRAFESPTGPSPVVPAARPQVPDWTTPQSAQPDDPSPWFTASLPEVDDVWREIPGPNSLTFRNLGQHNKLQQQEGGVDDIVVSPTEDAVAPSNTQPAQIESNPIPAGVATIVSQSVPLETISAPMPDTQGSTASKSRRKSTTLDVQASGSKMVPPLTPVVVRDQSPTPVLPVGQPKPVWAIEDESKKQKGGGATISLREIQEAEVKKAEARKAVEKERERAARANTTGSNVVVEEGQSFTSSWGLPTSQAGARNQAPSKEASIGNTTTATPATPVWTNTASSSTAKKTMKEIQEEEERRKKLAVKESMASAAARRAYAENALKVVPSAQTAGSPWTTVGSNGKPTAATSAPRPPVNSPSNNATTPTTLRSNGATTRQATTVKVATPRAEEFPITPSHDFLKWLSESLKGLNSSVNLEEITSMLLSFPLDPDQSTLEIISDLIYANSTTLDGRRFASEYVNKRKADAASRRGATGAPRPGSKPASIADVAKTQPKPVQQEWGFKVVNKKKKGGMKS